MKTILSTCTLVLMLLVMVAHTVMFGISLTWEFQGKRWQIREAMLKHPEQKEALQKDLWYAEFAHGFFRGSTFSD